MYAIVKTGGKQYKVCPGDKLNIEKLPAQVGDKVKLDAICVVDGDTTELGPQAAAKTAVEAVVLEQFKDKKKVVFKFKKRKNYKKLRGHRQQLMRVHIDAVGSEKAAAPKKAAAKKADEKPKKKRFQFLRDVKAEMKRVTWPTRTDVLRWSGVVVVALLFFGIFVAILDNAIITPLLVLISGISLG